MYLIKSELTNFNTLNEAYRYYSVESHIFGCLRAGMCRKIYVTFIIFAYITQNYIVFHSSNS